MIRTVAVLLLFTLIGFPSPVVAAGPQAVAFRIGANGIEVIDISGSSESKIAQLPLAGPIHDTLYQDDRLYVARGAAGVTIVDVTFVEQPKILGTFGQGALHQVVKLDARDTRLLVTYADGAQLVYDLTDRDAPQPLSAVALQSFPLTEQAASLPPAARTQVNDGVRMIGGGLGLLFGGLIFVLGGGAAIHAGETAVQNAHADAQRREMMCKQEKQFFCLNLDFSGLAGLGHGILGSVLIAVGASALIAGSALTVVGVRRRNVALTPAPLRAVSPGGAPAIGAGLALTW